MKFDIGDLVVRTDRHESNDHAVMKVERYSGDLVVVTPGSVSGNQYFEEDELDLVRAAADIVEEEVKIPEKNVLVGRTIQDVYDDINKLISQLVLHYQTLDIDKRLKLSIEAECYAGADGVDVQHVCQVGYDPEVKTYALDKSLDIATARYREDQSVKPKQIPLFKG